MLFVMRESVYRLHCIIAINLLSLMTCFFYKLTNYAIGLQLATTPKCWYLSKTASIMANHWLTVILYKNSDIHYGKWRSVTRCHKSHRIRKKKRLLYISASAWEIDSVKSRYRRAVATNWNLPHDLRCISSRQVCRTTLSQITRLRRGGNGCIDTPWVRAKGKTLALHIHLVRRLSNATVPGRKEGKILHWPGDDFFPLVQLRLLD